MACQYNSGELAPLDAIDPYIQDALDLIEFANGPVTSPWGARRAALGHPAPFNLKLLGVGNEQWGPQYIERFALFEKELGQKHPEITLIASADPNFRSENFPRQWDRLRDLKADFVDEHFYQPPDWFLKNVGRYDSYPRTGPKVFVGEDAAHVAASGPQNVRPSTLGRCAGRGGLHDRLRAECGCGANVGVRATTRAHRCLAVDAKPDLVRQPPLLRHAQLLRAADVRVEPGERVLPITQNGDAANGASGVYSSAAMDDGSREVIIKLVNPSGDSRDTVVTLGGRSVDGEATATTLTGESTAENSLAQPARVAPTNERFAVSGGNFTRTLPPHSLTVLRVPLASR